MLMHRHPMNILFNGTLPVFRERTHLPQADDITKNAINFLRTFADRFDFPVFSNANDESPVQSMKYDIVESDDEYRIYLDVPGIPQDAVKIEVADGKLVITGERQAEYKDQENAKSTSSIRFYGKFSNSFELPDDVDHDSISARSKDGVLTVTMKRVVEEARKPRAIEIKYE